LLVVLNMVGVQRLGEEEPEEEERGEQRSREREPDERRLGQGYE
jgi:hypothetical protein